MDFGFTEEQDDLAALARKILEDKTTIDALRKAEAGTDRFDRDTWSALANAGMLGVGLPEESGGAGFGVIEQCLVAREVGRTVAPVPLVAHTMMGADPIVRFGTGALRARWVPGAVDGSVILSGALAEPMNRWPDRPSTVASRDGAGWRITGVKSCVPAAPLADAFVVPARIDDDGDEVAAFVVEAGTAGVTVEPQQMTNRDRDGRVVLDDVVVGAEARLGDPEGGDGVVDWLFERATLGLCAQQLGIVERALELTADYTKERIQFDRPIATFQAVGQRAADAYIDVEAVRLTLWQAAWRLSEERSAATEVQVAKFWAADAGHRVGHTAVHLHGGAGVDVDHPIHRYFIAAKAIEFALGGSTDQLLRIGQHFATTRE
ncbi:MAG: acyl-CoA dehydrogenase family protein [Acidimicrobiales bacterium]